MTAALLLSKLEGVRQTGQGRYIARCPSHSDKSPSLAIRETDDGRVLVHCFAGCSAPEVVSSVGLELSDLFPPRPADPSELGKPIRRPFSADDALRCIDFEATVVCLCASDLAKGKALSNQDRERLLLAAGRITNALEATQ